MQQNAQVNHRIFLFYQLNISYLNLVTAPMEIRVPTPKPIHVPQVPVRVETREKAISPFVIPATAGVDESIESTATHSAVTDDNVETIKATYEDKIAKLHENYQYIILNFLFLLRIFGYLEQKFVD